MRSKQIKKNLLPHARAEEAVLYDAIIRVKNKKEDANKF
jgi:hemerythrin superfamily protein